MSKLGVLLFCRIFESGDARRIAKQKQDISDLIIQKDIPYLKDGDQGHLFDVYRPPSADEHAPVMINIHGGGLVASYTGKASCRNRCGAFHESFSRG